MKGYLNSYIDKQEKDKPLQDRKY